MQSREKGSYQKMVSCFFLCPDADCSRINLYVPPTTEEQEAITGILCDMDLDIYKLEEKLSKYQKIKQGMMDELLTGKVRLV